MLNLLPLSNVRLEFDEQDVENNNHFDDTKETFERNYQLPEFKQDIQYLEASNDSPLSTTSSFSTRNHFDKPEIEQDWDTLNDITEQESTTTNIWEDLQVPKEPPTSSSLSLFSKHVDSIGSQAEEIRNNLENEESENGQDLSLKFIHQDDYIIGTGDQQKEETDDNLESLENNCTIESVWISDTEDQEEMSRRPQILKIVDNDTTKKINRSLFTVQVDVEPIPENLQTPCDDQLNEVTGTIIDSNPQSGDIESEVNIPSNLTRNFS